MSRVLQKAQKWMGTGVEMQVNMGTMVAWLQGTIPPASEASRIVCNISRLREKFTYCKIVFIHEDWNFDCQQLA